MYAESLNRLLCLIRTRYLVEGMRTQEVGGGQKLGVYIRGPVDRAVH